MAELILVAVVGGLMVPVHADLGYTPAYDGHVYGCNENPLEGVVVIIEHANSSCGYTVYTNDTGYYFTSENVTYPVAGDLIIVTATYGELSATKEVIVTASGPLTVDFILCKEVPVFTPVGILALMSLLVVIVIQRTRKRR